MCTKGLNKIFKYERIYILLGYLRMKPRHNSNVQQKEELVDIKCIHVSHSCVISISMRIQPCNAIENFFFPFWQRLNIHNIFFFSVQISTLYHAYHSKIEVLQIIKALSYIISYTAFSNLIPKLVIFILKSLKRESI